jgi:hypothetical protein
MTGKTRDPRPDRPRRVGRQPRDRCRRRSGRCRGLADAEGGAQAPIKLTADGLTCPSSDMRDKARAAGAGEILDR